VLVATGDEDTFATIAMATEIAARFRGCSRTAVKGAGHWPQAERPEFVATLVSTFIASVPEGVGHNLPTA
jgi:pimeloyl-ACP methyl ester carboxylesterase